MGSRSIPPIPPSVSRICRRTWSSRARTKNHRSRTRRRRLHGVAVTALRDRNRKAARPTRRSSAASMVRTGDRSEKIRTYNFPTESCNRPSRAGTHGVQARSGHGRRPNRYSHRTRNRSLPGRTTQRASRMPPEDLRQRRKPISISQALREADATSSRTTALVSRDLTAEVLLSPTCLSVEKAHLYGLSRTRSSRPEQVRAF